jgi:hypothetical protein
MRTSTFRGTWWAASLLFAGLVAGCSSLNPVTPSAGQSSAPDAASAPPTTVPAIPTGVYRTRVTRDDLLSMGDTDLQGAGIWTLTVKPGTFELECRPISDPGEDCGHSPLFKTHPFLVEVGQLRGDRATVWFADDGARKAKLTGCDPHTECGPVDPYRFTWKTTGSGLRFSDLFVPGHPSALGANTVTNWTAKPWTKIA